MDSTNDSDNPLSGAVDSDTESFPRGGIVTARGTGDGLVIRLDCRAQPDELEDALVEFLSSRRGFLQGNGVYLEWVGSRPSEHLSARVVKIISEDFRIKVLESRAKSDKGLSSEESEPPKGIAPLNLRSDPLRAGLGAESDLSAKEVELSLFDGMKSAGGYKDEYEDDQSDLFTPQADAHFSTGSGSEGQAAKHGGVKAEIWDDPDARIVYGTLRSGQKIETEHSIVICGDVNSGADVVAGGDIIVLGTLRGVAHAGAYDQTGGGRFIFALDLRPTQLRIGTVISRGAEERTSGPELAKIEGNIIVVEPYRSRISPRAL